MRTGVGVARERQIRIGVQVSPQHTGWAEIRRACLDAEALGVDLVFNWDHFWPLSGDPAGDHYECWTTLGAWAEATSRVEIGPLVTAAGYRNPDLVADMARTLDHVSGGRFVLGLGAGFREKEYVEYGLPFGSPSERIRQLEDAIERIVRRFERLNPAPLRRMPILLAGGGEQKMLRLVARYADIWNTFAEREDFARKSGILDGFCERIGRDPKEIERSVLVEGDPEAVGEPLREMGVSLFIIDMHAPFDFTNVKEWLAWRDA